MRRALWFLLAATPLLALSYKMEVRLDIDKKTISGSETIVWQNTGDAPTAVIPFHLYMNAFSGEETIFFRESAGRHRGYSSGHDLKEFGYCLVRGIKVNGRNAEADFHTLSRMENPGRFNLFWPDEISLFNRPDDTIGVLELPQPLAPGEQVTLEVAFETKLPKVFARAGYYKNFIMAGQWYPKIAVFQGQAGWNVHFYHANSEFFSDFADFDVSIDAPAGHKLGATGRKVADIAAGDRRRLRFLAENVGDFAFSAWEKFGVAYDRWKGVELILLHQPGNECTVRRQFRALKAALDACSRLTGFDYPYPCFTLIDPPFRAMGAAGMEYPMLVTGGVFSPFIPESIVEADFVIVHEFIHNYFYGMVASNEFEHAWMDEGLTSYATGFAMERFLQPQVQNPPFRMNAFAMDAIQGSMYHGPDFPAKAAWQFHGGYSSLSYGKPSVYLKTLENLIGPEKMIALFSAYFDRWKFKHPRPEDFFAVVAEKAGEAHAEFMRRAITSSDRLDFAITEARSVDAANRPRTRLDPAKGRLVRDPAPRPKAKPRYENTVVAGNHGQFTLPVTILAEMEGGQQARFEWDGRGEWKKFEWVSERPLKSARIDPEGIYACDAAPHNNTRVTKPKDSGAYSRLAAFLAMAAELLFSGLVGQI